SGVRSGGAQGERSQLRLAERAICAFANDMPGYGDLRDAVGEGIATLNPLMTMETTPPYCPGAEINTASTRRGICSLGG
ncbi:MAG: hypothetical protein ACRDSG_16370, partial [Pseudonocardiaceae bacterium]